MIRRRDWLDAILLPPALVVVVLEDVVWAGLRAVLRRVSDLPPLRRLEARLGVPVPPEDDAARSGLHRVEGRELWTLLDRDSKIRQL